MRLEQNWVPVPGHPVYRDPRLDSNLFFYDDLIWVYADDNRYASSWYNGPWDLISRAIALDCVLRVPPRFSGAPRPGAGAGLGFSTISTTA